MVCGLLLLPCSFLKNLHHVSSLSFWNGIVHVVINAIILGYCLLRYKEINIVNSELVQINIFRRALDIYSSCDFRLQNTHLGLLKSDTEHRHIVVPNRSWCNCIQLHLSNLCLHLGRKHARSIQISLHAELVARCCSGFQGPFWICRICHISRGKLLIN